MLIFIHLNQVFSGLAGESAWEQALVDSYNDIVNDLWTEKHWHIMDTAIFANDKQAFVSGKNIVI